MGKEGNWNVVLVKTVNRDQGLVIHRNLNEATYFHDAIQIPWELRESWDRVVREGRIHEDLFP